MSLPVEVAPFSHSPSAPIYSGKGDNNGDDVWQKTKLDGEKGGTEISAVSTHTSDGGGGGGGGERFLLHIEQSVLPLRDFGAEFRAMADVEHIFRSMIVLLDVADTSLDGILERFDAARSFMHLQFVF